MPMPADRSGPAVGTEALMQTFRFTLLIAGRAEIDQELEDALYEGGCDDALLSVSNGQILLDFDREGTSITDAILSAIKDVEAAALGIQVMRVLPDELVTGAEIARR